jgi:hypothetical protein
MDNGLSKCSRLFVISRVHEPFPEEDATPACTGCYEVVGGTGGKWVSEPEEFCWWIDVFQTHYVFDANTKGNAIGLKCDVKTASFIAKSSSETFVVHFEFEFIFFRPANEG